MSFTIVYKQFAAFREVDLRVKRSNTIDLSNTVVRDIIDMNPHEFSAHIDILYMGGMRLLSRFYLD